MRVDLAEEERRLAALGESGEFAHALGEALDAVERVGMPAVDRPDREESGGERHDGAVPRPEKLDRPPTPPVAQPAISDDGDAGGGQEQQRRELGADRQCDGEAEQQAAHRRRSFQPQQEREKRRGEGRGERRVGRRQPGMGEKHRQIGEQDDGQRRLHPADMAAGPQPDHHQRGDKERQHAEPRQRQQLGVGAAAGAVEDAAALDPHVAAILRMVAGEKRPERLGDPRQRRVQRLVGELVLVEQLHAGGDMRRLVEGDRQHVIGCRDPKYSEHDREQRDPPQYPGQRNGSARPRSDPETGCLPLQS